MLPMPSEDLVESVTDAVLIKHGVALGHERHFLSDLFLDRLNCSMATISEAILTSADIQFDSIWIDQTG